MHALYRPIVTVVGPRSGAHPSFAQAFECGVLLTWVSDWGELQREMRNGRVSDVIVFDTKYQSEEQCRACRALVSSGYQVLCLGCSDTECGPCHIKERDLLSAILIAAATR